MRPSGIGGQAVMEGVMMKHGSEYAVAVRKADQTIVVKKESYHSIAEKFPVLKAPFLRGIVNFIESLYLGMKTLMYSASFFEEEEEKRKEEWEEWISTGTGSRFAGGQKKKVKRPKNGFSVFLEKAGTFFMMLCSFMVALGLFLLLPMFLSDRLAGLEASTKKAVLEGIFRLLIFFLYLLGISKMEDIKRVFMYHGAEHKAINCIENGLELTVENVRGQSRQHKRCGTSFLFFVVLLSIVFFMFLRTEVLWQKVVFRLLLVPVIAAVSYEFIRLAGRSENPVIAVLSKPGLWLQKLTTKEPEDEMIEVAIQSVEAVFDWRAFLSGNPVGKEMSHVSGDADAERTGKAAEKIKQTGAEKAKEAEKSDAETVQKKNNWIRTDGMLRKKEADLDSGEGQEEASAAEETAARTLSELTKERLQRTLSKDEYRMRERSAKYASLQEEEEAFCREDGGLLPNEEEDDAILKALDKFFGES